MPGFYNAAIDLAQRLALRRWLAVSPGTPVLDVGCGVGRWSRRLARRGARVTGIDVSPTMVEEARRRARAEGLEDRCAFAVGNLATLALGRRFSLVLAVTVLQHVVEDVDFEAAVTRLAAHLAPGGRMILLEAAPSGRAALLETPTLRFRAEERYRASLAAAGLRSVAVTGVDPLPLKIRFLPLYARLPGALGIPLLALLTAASLPIEVLLGRAWVGGSWHKVFVVQRDATE
jgi:SAM-dependent methyltransferase